MIFIKKILAQSYKDGSTIASKYDQKNLEKIKPQRHFQRSVVVVVVVAAAAAVVAFLKISIYLY